MHTKVWEQENVFLPLVLKHCNGYLPKLYTLPQKIFCSSIETLAVF